MEEFFRIDYNNHTAYQHIRIRFYEKIYYKILFFKTYVFVQVGYFFKKKYLRSSDASIKEVVKLTHFNDFLEKGFLQLTDTSIDLLLAKN